MVLDSVATIFSGIDLAKPEYITELRRFLSFVEIFRRDTSNVSETAILLTGLEKNGSIDK